MRHTRGTILKGWNVYSAHALYYEMHFSNHAGEGEQSAARAEHGGTQSGETFECACWQTHLFNYPLVLV